MAKSDSPNTDIDYALKKLMLPVLNKSDANSEIPIETKIKIINTAIAWEKVKHKIQDSDTDFNPDA